MTTCFYSDGHNSASPPRKKNNTASSGLVKDIQRVWRVPDGAELHRDPSTLPRCCSSSIRRIHIQRLPASSVPMKIATALFCATCSRAAVLVGAAPLVYCSARPGSRNRGSGSSGLRASRCDVEKNLSRSLSPTLLSVLPQGSSGWKAPPLGICAFEACHSCRGIYIYIWLSHKEEINCICSNTLHVCLLSLGNYLGRQI